MCSAISFISYPKDGIIDLGQILDLKIWKWFIRSLDPKIWNVA